MPQSHHFALLGLLGMFSLPFLVWQHALPLPGFYNEWLAALFGLGALAALFSRRTFQPLELPLILVLPIGLALILLAQAWLGMVVFPGQARLAIIYLLFSALLIISTRSVSRVIGPERLIPYLAWAMLAGGILNAVIAVIQWQALHSSFDGILAGFPRNHYFGNLAQANHFADHQALALCALLFLYATKRIPMWLAVGTGLALLLGLALSGSRSAWLYLAALAVVSILYRRSHKSAASRGLLWASVLSLPVFLLIQLGLGMIESHALTATERLISAVDSGTGYTIDQRKTFIQSAWVMFIDAPVLGGGYQNFAWHYFQTLASLPEGIINPYENIYAENAHNLFLHILAEFGSGGCFLLLVLIYWVYVSYREVSTPERWMVLGMVGVIGVHSMFEYPLYYMHFLGIASVLAALADDRVLKIDALRRVGPAIGVAVLPLGAGLLMMLYTGNAAMEALYRAYESRHVMQHWRGGAMESYLQTARGMGFFQPSIESFIVNLAVEVPDESKLGVMLPLSERVMRRQANAVNVYRHALLLGLAGRCEEGLRLYSQATRAYPAYQNAFMGKLAGLIKEYPRAERLHAIQKDMQTRTGPSMPDNH